MSKKKLELFMRKAAELYKNADQSDIVASEQNQQEEQKKYLEAESPEISEKINKIAEKSKEHKEEIHRVFKEVLDHKEKGHIGEESINKIIDEVEREQKKGISKEEVRDLVKELFKSEILKNENMWRHEEREKFAQESSVDVPKEGRLEIPLPSGGVERELEEGSQKVSPEWVTQDLTKINVTYPLVYSAGKVRVYANIRYDPQLSGLVYRVLEPPLSEWEEEVLKKIENTLIDELEVDFAMLKKQSAEKYLESKVNRVIDYYNMKMTFRAREVIDYYIRRDFIGLGKIEPIMLDTNIEDISCDGVNIPLYIYHRDPRFGSMKTSIAYDNEDELNSFVMKLSQRCGRSISVAEPLLDGALHDGSRVQATFGIGISMKGSNFTIRKFTKDPLTFVDLLNYKTVNSEMLAYLWLAIEHGKSILVAGPTASGKTTLLNALSLFIRPELKIVSIEDTPELRLPHENWISQVSRSGFGPEGATGKKLGEVSLFDLLKASLRQRPDIIIVGEVRGVEAYVLFQQMATGHPGMSTLHAESMEGVVNRLRTPPINLPPSLVQHLDILMILTRQRIRGRYIRRTKSVEEILGYDMDRDVPLSNATYGWDIPDDKYTYSGKSSILREIMDVLGTTPEGVYEEVQRRMDVIEWMQRNNIRDYINVGRVVSEYYQSPERLMEEISKG